MWQGYYSAEGLDVEIRSASTAQGPMLSPVEAITTGKAQFAIGAIDILLAKDKGHDLAILAPIFQRNPVSIFALPSTRMGSVLELAKLRIAAPKDNDTRAEVIALFRAQGINLDSVTFVEVTPNVASLEAGLADAIATFAISAKFQAKERNLQLTELSPANYGLDFYGDTLYTSRAMVNENPEVVERFVRASLKGWQYALQHRIKVADRISREFPRHTILYKNTALYNRTFARQINEYLAYPYLQLGHNNHARWYRMVEQLRSIGIIKGDWEIESLFVQPQAKLEIETLTLYILLALVFLLLFIIYFVRHEKRTFAPYFLILIAFVFAELELESNLRETQFNHLRLDVTQQLVVISARLSSSINRNLSILSGLAAHIATNPTINQDEFALYARTVFDRDPLLINLAAAPDYVISMIYPLEQNKGALGLDYRTNEAQKEAVLQLKDSGDTVIAGPVNLVQGGVAFIGRTAVYATNESGQSSFWGIVSAPIRAAELYQSVGLLDPSLPLSIAIRGNDGHSITGEVFFGEKKLFHDERSIITDITAGSGSWQIAAIPKDNWDTVSNEIWILRSAAVFTVLAFMILVLIRYRQIIKDRHYQDQIKQSESLLQEVGKLALIGGWKIHSDEKTCLLSPQSAETLGLHRRVDQSSLKDVISVFDKESAAHLQQKIKMAVRHGSPFDLELSIEHSGKPQKWVRIIGHPNYLLEGRFEVIGAIQDITERKQFTEVIQQQATYDLLTGLPNRFLFENRLDKAITHATRHQGRLALLFVDLDNFKPVNDHLGHKAGDIVLKQVGERIGACIRESDTLARYSGDEFTIILHDIESISAPSNVAETILKTINLPFDIMETQIFCGASIGISIFPDDGSNVDKLVSNADHAMYEVKKSGRNDWRYFTETMQEESERKHILRTRLATAISTQQLEVYYQPVIELNSNQVTNCEALARWKDESGNLISTEAFIAVAEEAGIINQIDRFVLKTATRFLTDLNRDSDHKVGLSVNVSPRLFSAQDKSMRLWLEIITEAAQELDITVEITERLLTDDSNHVAEILDNLKAAGVKISIDDFGTGYSSLSYLTKFPIDIIKIDRGFIKNIGIDQPTEILTDTIISLAHRLSLTVVAEGVENSTQLAYVHRQGCEYAQGFLLGKPQNEQSFKKLLAPKTSQRESL